MTPLLQAALICLMALLPQAAFAQRAPLSGFGIVTEWLKAL